MYCDFPELGRCCFCMPLRRGVLTFGYLNFFFSVFMLGVYSYYINAASGNLHLIYHGSLSMIPAEACLFIYCLEIVFNLILLYGTHLKKLLFVKIFYYFAIVSTVASVMIQLLDASEMWMRLAIETISLTFAGLCLQLYLIILVRSLIKKLMVDGDHVFENQLHQIVTGERKFNNASNGIYDANTVVPNNPNDGFALFALSLDVYFSDGFDLSTHTFGFYRGTSFIAERWLFFLMYCVEIAFILVLLIGVHTRNSRLMLVYYYYGITTTLASLATFMFVNVQEFHTHIPLYLIDITIIFSAIVTQAYLLLLIRSELEKPRESLRFVNHLAEVCVQQPATNGLNPL
ncbi:uncharacterized protein LOC134653706 [Cydia amplana]|uniref:uncharacterized protein LOC134653706 n=1 Tax=Cydia amplana TaxID=1869771 RepID=UPI002FE63C8A